MSKLPEAVEDRIRHLPLWLQSHIERSREVAMALAAFHSVEESAVDLAISSHDLAKSMPGADILNGAMSYGLDPIDIERVRPELLHGAVAALWLEKTVGIKDHRVLEAVRWHTTGRKCMGMVAKIVFLADKLDPHKVKKLPWLDEIEVLAKENISLALRYYLEGRFRHLLDKGELIHPESIEFRNSLMMQM